MIDQRRAVLISTVERVELFFVRIARDAAEIADARNVMNSF